MTMRRCILAGLVGVTLVLPVPAVAAPTTTETSAVPGISYAGSWAGRTGQDKPIKFRINSDNRVTYVSVGYRVNGGYCTVTATTTLRNLSARINSEQRFTVRKTMANTTLVVRGLMLSRTKASGRLHVTLTDPTGYGCAGTLGTSWRAHKVT